jgi:simple sugar transport system permease protein
LLAGAALFGFADALQLRDSAAIHALLLLIVAFLIFASWRAFKKGQRIAALVALAAGIFFAWFFIAYSELPAQLVTMTPYLATLIVLSLASQRLRGPAAAGLPYRRGGLK